MLFCFVFFVFLLFLFTQHACRSKRKNLGFTKDSTAQEIEDLSKDTLLTFLFECCLQDVAWWCSEPISHDLLSLLLWDKRKEKKNSRCHQILMLRVLWVSLAVTMRTMVVFILYFSKKNKKKERKKEKRRRRRKQSEHSNTIMCRKWNFLQLLSSSLK